MPNQGTRPNRSRKIRPCDECRRLKQSCQIMVPGQPCSTCQKGRKACTFEAPPLKRHFTSSVSPQPPLARKHKAKSRAAGDSGEPTNAQEDPLVEFFRTFLEGENPGAFPEFDAPHAPAVDEGTSNVVANRSASRTVDARKSTADWTEEEDPMKEFFESLVTVNDITGSDRYIPPLDNSLATNAEESQYVGSGSFSLLTLSDLAGAHGGSPFIRASPDGSIDVGPPGEGFQYRQVGVDPSRPVFFLRNPTKVQGGSRDRYSAALAYENMVEVIKAQTGDGLLPIINHWINHHWPNLPIFNRKHVEACIDALENDRHPDHHIVLAISAHAAASMPATRVVARQLSEILRQYWKNMSQQSSFVTLQMCLMQVYERPSLPAGALHASICQALGISQVLGLHRDCSAWRLPAWEKSIRKRIWWSLCIADKWNAFVYGRPSNITDLEAVPIPIIEDRDCSITTRRIAPFISMCHLTVILDLILPFSLASQIDDYSAQKELSVLRKASRELYTRSEIVEAPHCAYGVTLCRLMVKIEVCRLALENSATKTTHQLLIASQQAAAVVEGAIKLLENLDSEARRGFWTPWSSFSISHSLALVLRQAVLLNSRSFSVATMPSDPIPPLDNVQALIQTHSQQVMSLVERMVLVTQHGINDGWEVAQAALPRIRVLIASLPIAIPGIEMVRRMLNLAPVQDVSLDVGSQQVDDWSKLFTGLDWMTGLGSDFHTF